MKIEPKNIQVGDRVTVSGTVKELFELSGQVRVQYDGSIDTRCLSADELAHAEITRPEKPLAVRDTVRTRNGEVGVIVDLHRDVAWIEPEPGRVWPLTPDDKSPQWVPISCLTRIEETRRD